MILYLNIITAVSVIVTIISSTYFVRKFRKQYLIEKSKLNNSALTARDFEEHSRRLKTLIYHHYKLEMLNVEEVPLDISIHNVELRRPKKIQVSPKGKSRSYELKSDPNTFENSFNEKDFEVIFAN